MTRHIHTDGFMQVCVGCEHLRSALVDALRVQASLDAKLRDREEALHQLGCLCARLESDHDHAVRLLRQHAAAPQRRESVSG